MTNQYKRMADGSTRAPFEEQIQVDLYIRKHQGAIDDYKAKQVLNQPVSRDTPTNLGAILLDMTLPVDKPKPKVVEHGSFAGSLLDTQALKAMRALSA